MDKLTEIRELQNQTTDGEWEADGFGTVYSKSSDRIIAEVFDHDDAEFIAKSHAFITYLLQLVETQAKALTEIREEATNGVFRGNVVQTAMSIKNVLNMAEEAIKLTQV